MKCKCGGEMVAEPQGPAFLAKAMRKHKPWSKNRRIRKKQEKRFAASPEALSARLVVPPIVKTPVVVFVTPVPRLKSSALVPVAQRRFLFAATVEVPHRVLAPVLVMNVPVLPAKVLAALPVAVRPLAMTGDVKVEPTFPL